MRSSILLILLFFVLTFGQEDTMDGEQCNDVILYDIMKKASKTTIEPAAIRQTTIETMQMVFPLARSMGCICTDHKFQFPNLTNHRYCSVRVSTFRCYAIVF